MMWGMVRSRPSPMQLVVRAIGGAALAGSAFLLPLPHHGGWLPRALIFSVPFFCGLLISFRAENRLKQNRENLVWTEIELRQTIAPPVVRKSDLLELSNFKPIQSARWGKAKQDGGELLSSQMD
jgi:hypothetical protein